MAFLWGALFWLTTSSCQSRVSATSFSNSHSIYSLQVDNYALLASRNFVHGWRPRREPLAGDV